MHIAIAGGGTAGWLSALFVSKIHPEFTVTLIENSKIGVIGTGEGSTGIFQDVLTNKIWDFGCDLDDFLKKTKSTPKLGIHFKNWGVPDYVSPIDGSIFSGRMPDILTLHAIATGQSPHITSKQGVRALARNTPFNDRLYIKNSTLGTAHHFDGQLVSQYFKSICKTVKIIDDEIIDFTQRGNGSVSEIVCKEQTISDVDLIIDCLGFNSIFNRKLPSDFVDYSKNLPVNTAIPFQLDNDDLENTLPVTTSTAMDYGWMWQIPVGKRFGSGYVFNGDLITPDQAVEEAEKYIGKKIKPIKTIKFTSGRLKGLWRHNIVSMGLSSGFLEPLQATAIHTVISHLMMLCFECMQDNQVVMQNYSGKDLYNKRAGKYFDDFADFINLHYQTPREDTEFWRYMKYESATDFVKDIKNVCRARIPTHNDFEKYGFAAGVALWNPTIHALGLLSPSTAKRQLDFCQNKFYTPVQDILNSHVNDIETESTRSVKEFYKEYSKYY
jgi:tryptophan halogenase